MNDDLIVRISVNCSTVLSFWMALTDFNRKGTTRSEEICSGYFSESSITMNWEEMNQPNRTDLPRCHKFLTISKKILFS